VLSIIAGLQKEEKQKEKEIEVKVAIFLIFESKEMIY
jgi:hypothetical protein